MTALSVPPSANADGNFEGTGRTRQQKKQTNTPDSGRNNRPAAAGLLRRRVLSCRNFALGKSLTNGAYCSLPKCLRQEKEFKEVKT